MLRGPAYVRKLRGRAPTSDLRERRAILLVSDEVCPTLEVVQQAVRTAFRQRSKLYLIQVLGNVVHDDGRLDGLRDTFALGELLTAAVLRAGEGRLPPAVTILVHVGGRESVIDFVTSTIQPDLIIAEQTLLSGRSSALPELIGSAQGCPVLLIPTSADAPRDLPELIRVEAAPKLLN